DGDVRLIRLADQGESSSDEERSPPTYSAVGLLQAGGAQLGGFGLGLEFILENDSKNRGQILMR
ncbi:hybrid sensor histidine kinase/response regulator, partial [Burkholderia pseudomallei]